MSLIPTLRAADYRSAIAHDCLIFQFVAQLITGAGSKIANRIKSMTNIQLHQQVYSGV